MTTVLTGATGFLGSRLAYALLADGHQEVTVLGRGASNDLRARVVAGLEAAAGTPVPAHIRKRLRCLTADITVPRLGMHPTEYEDLAHHATEIWHCAGDVNMHGNVARMRPTNVNGVLRLLEFSEQAAPNCPLIHVSTAFVAGRRPSGVILERELDGSYGFSTGYEQSKYEAEVAIHGWAHRTGRRVVVLRPSVLAADSPIAPGGAGHPLGQLGKSVEALRKQMNAGRIARLTTVRAGAVLRVVGDSSAVLNIVQVDYALRAMTQAVTTSLRDTPSGITTFHITHPVDTPLQLILAAVEARFPGPRIQLVPTCDSPTIVEQFIAARLSWVMGVMGQRRSYDRSELETSVPDLPDPRPIDRGYLTRALSTLSPCPTS